MERAILHADCNKFYASVEKLYHPELKGKPFIVGGDPQKRHGIVLTKSEEATVYGIQTGEPLWQAFQKCPSLLAVSPNYERYEVFSKAVYDLYGRYTDRIEPFGMDEAWLDLTHTQHLFGSAESAAYEIKEAVKREIGITVSIGVSFNKVFAKMGSDYKKPDAVTVFSRDNFRERIWPLPLSDMLYAGRHTVKRLERCMIRTIGDLAKTDPAYLVNLLGKQGRMLYDYANGNDLSPVVCDPQDIQSISNSTTPARDLESEEEVKQYFYLLSEHIAKRMEQKDLQAKTVCISVRDTKLKTKTRQTGMKAYTRLSAEIAQQAFSLFCRECPSMLPLRSIGVAVTDFGKEQKQTDLWGEELHRRKLCAAEDAVNSLKARYGEDCIRHGLLLTGDDIRKHSDFGHCVFNHLNFPDE